MSALPFFKNQRVFTTKGPGTVVGFEEFINNGMNGVVKDKDCGACRVIVALDDKTKWPWGTLEHPDPYFMRHEVTPV